MDILVIDGQGGGIGKGLIERLRSRLPSVNIVAAGTNALATSAMLKAGANVGATGENAVIYNCRSADIICGPIGIIMANAMYGELTPAIAQAVGESRAQRVLIPVSLSHTWVAGVEEKSATRYLDDAAEIVTRIFREVAL